MTAVQLGPVVLSTPRFAALLGLAVFLIAAHLLERRRPGAADWAWTSALVVAVGARLGFVLENLDVYLREPLTILYIQQGGFSPLWGLAAASVYTLWRADLRRHVLPVALLGLAVWGGAQALLTPAPGTQVVRPDVPLTTLAGQPVDLDGIVAGRPAVVNLWAPWCLPCRRETPMLIDVAASHPETAVALADQASSVPSVLTFLDERELSHDDVYLDASARLGRDLGSVGLPTTYFFAADGALVHTHVGEISRAELERRIRELHR